MPQGLVVPPIVSMWDTGHCEDITFAQREVDVLARYISIVTSECASDEERCSGRLASDRDAMENLFDIASERANA